MRLRHLLSRATVVALTATTLSATTGTNPVSAGAAIAVRLVKGGLNQPDAFTFTPRGLIYYLERSTGEVRVLNLTRHTDRLFFTISNVNGDGERGALGIALDPGWPQRTFVYVYVTRTVNGTLRNQILRIRAQDGHGVGFHVLFQTTAVTVQYHNGGRILFGPGGDLYAMVGDGHTDANAQDLTANPRGKILRMKPDGTVPDTNPIHASRIWSFGHRNSFGFTFDPQTGHLWETENGPSCNDEINLVARDGNYGWGPNENCSGSSPAETNNSGPAPRLMPKWWIESPIGITGDAFCHGCGLGSQFEGDLFFGAVNAGQLRVLQMNGARNDFLGTAQVILTAPNSQIISMETAPNGTIYFSDETAIYKLVPA
jgi:glucose/arabinose dehydrogenase